MCGICGVYNYKSGEPVSVELVRAMTRAMVHRGPDDEGSHMDGAVGLGMRRLSIIDLEGGMQPMPNEDGSVWAVCNGEIYNFKELRKELESYGHVFKSRSDTESMIHAYEQWGLDALGRLNGMFGLAIWDTRERRLVVARDPFGIKPLYFWDDGRSVAFGSEVRALLRHPAITRELDPVALDQFLTLTYVPSPRTAFRGVSKLLPGHTLVCSQDGCRLHRFHRVVPRQLDARRESDLVEELRDRIVTAVGRQMVADVPVGVMLSGGVDSSAIATVMTEHVGGPIQTFSVGFEGAFDQNELEWARQMATCLGSDHHEVVISAAGYSEFLPQSVWHLEEPIATDSTLAFFKVCQLAREHVKVALTGQGADEPFAGYQRYLGERHGPAYRALPGLLRRGVIAPLVEALPRNERAKRAVRSLSESDPLARMTAIYTIFNGQMKRDLYRDEFVTSDDLQEVVGLWQGDVASLDGLSQILYVDARLHLPDSLLMYGDKESMAVSLETRVPFLDLELMEFAESIPTRLKIKGHTRKYLLRKAVSKWLPAEVLSRKKVPFATPVDEWFRRELRTHLEERLLARSSACREYFKPETVRQMIRDHESGRHDYKRALFSLLTFELWYEQFIRPARVTAPAGAYIGWTQ